MLSAHYVSGTALPLETQEQVGSSPCSPGTDDLKEREKRKVVLNWGTCDNKDIWFGGVKGWSDPFLGCGGPREGEVLRCPEWRILVGFRTESKSAGLSHCCRHCARREEAGEREPGGSGLCPQAPGAHSLPCSTRRTRLPRRVGPLCREIPLFLLKLAQCSEQLTETHD